MLASDWHLGLLVAALLAHTLIVYHLYRARGRRSGDAAPSESTAAGNPPPREGRSAVTCQHCGAENDDGYRYCWACASELPRNNSFADSSNNPLGRIPR
jgi:hypothetical protein